MGYKDIISSTGIKFSTEGSNITASHPNINQQSAPGMNGNTDETTLKAPLDGEQNGARREDRSNDRIVKVQPPKREDLQPSYAQVIKPDSEDARQHGWYGGMINTLGALIGNCGAIPCCIKTTEDVGEGPSSYQGNQHTGNSEFDGHGSFQNA